MACGCDVIGAGFELDLSAGASLGEVTAEADKVIGEATDAYADAQAAYDEALAIGKGVDEAVKQLDMTGRDVGDAILAVAANPLTHTALGALAVAAPPFTTVLAGIGEVLVGAAAAAVPLVQLLESTWNDIFMSYTAKAAKRWGVSEAEAQRIIDQKADREQLRKDFEANKKKATEALADLKAKALAGDRDAVKAVAALDSLMSSDVLLLTTVLRFGCDPKVSAVKTKGAQTGLTPWQLCDVARTVVADQERAAGMSDKEFAHYSKLGRGVTTDKDGKQTGYRLDVVSEGGKQVAALVDASTGKTIAKGTAAQKEWQKGFHFLLDPKTRRVKLTDVLRSDYLDAFKSTLFANWQKLDKSASDLAKKQEKARMAELEKKAKAEAKRVGILTGQVSVTGTLVSDKGKLSDGKFRVDKSKGKTGWLVRGDGLVMKDKWVRA